MHTKLKRNCTQNVWKECPTLRVIWGEYCWEAISIFWLGPRKSSWCCSHQNSRQCKRKQTLENWECPMHHQGKAWLTEGEHLLRILWSCWQVFFLLLCARQKFKANSVYGFVAIIICWCFYDPQMVMVDAHQRRSSTKDQSQKLSRWRGL